MMWDDQQQVSEGRELSKNEVINNAFIKMEEGSVFLSRLALDSRDSEYINTKDSLMISLFLNNNIFLDTGCRYFQRSNWKCLRELHIGGNLISDKGCRYLTKVSWPLLEVLYMDRNEISTIGIMHLFKGLWNHLKSINLFQNRIDARGIIYLCRSSWKLLYLDLWCNNEIGYDGLRKLYYFQRPRELKVLNIKDKLAQLPMNSKPNYKESRLNLQACISQNVMAD